MFSDDDLSLTTLTKISFKVLKSLRIFNLFEKLSFVIVMRVRIKDVEKKCSRVKCI